MIWDLSRLNRRNFFLWISLAWQAGAINAGGFLACHRFVSHTTGFATHFGADFAQGLVGDAIGMLSVPLFFLIGTILTTLIVDKPRVEGHPPNWHWVMVAIAFILSVLAFGGSSGKFGEFGSNTNRMGDYVMIITLSLVCGMQNALISVASKFVVRTTHLTGLTTDLGIGIVRLLRKTSMESAFTTEQRERELKMNGMRVGIISGFIFGSTLGAFLFLEFKFLAFLVPAATALAIAYDLYRLRYSNFKDAPSKSLL